MSIIEPESEEWWDIQEPIIPKRSSLFNLEPIGIGTPQVESLTGYIQRLAHEHCLSTWVLLSRKIGPSIDKEYISKNCERNLSAFFSKGNMLNGTGTVAQDWVRSLEDLTGEKNLKFLTLLSFAEVLPLRELFRKNRAWCPYCYADQSSNEQVRYEPLVWTLNDVEVCIYHKEPLQCICPKCNQKIPSLSRKAPLDHCSICGEWFGANKTHGSLKIKKLEDKIVQQTSAAKNIGDLVASAPSLHTLSADTIRKNLLQLATYITSGNIHKFARELLMPPGVIQRACSGMRTLSLKNLLEICYQLNISLVSLLTSDSNILDTIDYNCLLYQRQQELKDRPTLIDNSHSRKKNLDQGKIIALMETLLEGDVPPPPLSQIAKKVGCIVKTLRYHASDLCDQVVQRRRELQTAGVSLNSGSLIRSFSSTSFELLTPEELRDKLFSALEENPPRTVQAIAKELGYSTDVLYDRCADLCHQIAEQWRRFQSESRKRNIEQACEEVHQIVIKLHSQGKYISHYTVSKELSKPAYLRDEQVYSLFILLKSELLD